MGATLIAIDLAKETFQLHAVDEKGRCLYRKTVKRRELAAFIQNTPPCIVAMEACAGSNYWAQIFRAMGHTPKLIAAQYVKPFVKSQKNDRNDAEGIGEAAMRPSMRFVAVKESWQQDMQTLHRVRDRLKKEKTALDNQTRGILLEFGITIPEGIAQFKKRIPEILEDDKNGLSLSMRALVRDQYDEFLDMEKRKTKYDVMIEKLSKDHLECSRLMAIPGVGPLISTAFVSALGDPHHFKNGRQVSAWLGLVPRQYSTGGKTRLGAITKRGDCYLRALVVHGSRSCVTQIMRRQGKDPFSQRVLKLVETRGINKAVIAVANRNTRVMWALLKSKTDYRTIEAN